MNHISKIDALHLDDAIKYEESAQHGDYVHQLCNAAIEYYIAQQEAPTKEQT